MNVYEKKSWLHPRSLDEEFEHVVRSSPLSQLKYRDVDVPDNNSRQLKTFMSVTAKLRPVMVQSPLACVQHNSMNNSALSRISALVSPPPQTVLNASMDPDQSIASVFKNLKNSSFEHSLNSSVDSGIIHAVRTESVSAVNSLHSGYIQPPVGSMEEELAVSTSYTNSTVSSKHRQTLSPVTENTACIKGQNKLDEDEYDSELESTVDETLQEDDSTANESTSLYMWIIKPVPDTSHICVEGKKSLSEVSFWHSGIVKERIGPHLVLTQTGSLYKLEGPMEVRDALLEGFSQETVDSFRDGFPGNWEDVIKKHFLELYSNGTREVERELEGGNNDDDNDDGISFMEMELESPAKGIVDQPESNPILHAKTNGKVADKQKTTQQKMVSKVKASVAKQKQKDIILSKWIVKPHSSGKGIFVVGCKPDEKLWHTATIVKRLEQRKVRSSTGSVYLLKGNIDKLAAIEEGIPKTVISAFRTGFPKEWQEITQEHFRPPEQEDSKNENVDPAGKTKSRKQTQNPNMSRSIWYPVTKSEKLEAKQVLSDPKRKTNVVLTPHGQVVDLQNLQRSKSGRIIKPPLNWWTGQRLSLDSASGIQVTCNTPYAAQYLDRITESFLNPVKKYRSSKNIRTSNSFDCGKNTSTSKVQTIQANKTLSDHQHRDASGTDIRKESDRKSMPCKRESHQSSGSSRRCSRTPNTDTESSKHAKKVERKQKDKKIRNGSDSFTRTKLNVKTANQRREEQKSPKLVEEISKVLDKNRQKYLKKQQSERQTCYNRDRKRQEKLDKGQSNPDVYDIDKVLGSSIDESGDKTLTNSVELGIEHHRHSTRETRSSCQSGGHKRSSGSISEQQEHSKSSRTTASKVNTAKAAATGGSATSQGFKKSQVNQLNSIKEVESEDDVPEHSSLRLRSRSQHRKESTDQKHSVSPMYEHSRSKTRGGSKSSKDGWSKEEKDRLHRACREIPQLDPQYWEKVAQRVQNRSVQECQDMFYGNNETPTPEKVKTKKPQETKVKASVPVVTARKGTLKRKQQLKDVLIHHNKDYEDDLFDSTPFRSKQKNKMPRLDDEDEDEDAVFEKLARKQGKSRFETPMATSSFHPRITRGFASETKTPASNLNLDILEDEDDDGYIHRVIKRNMVNRGRKKKTGRTTPATGNQKHQKGMDSPQKRLFEEFLKEREEKRRHDNSGEDEEDYYWSEAENT